MSLKDFVNSGARSDQAAWSLEEGGEVVSLEEIFTRSGMNFGSYRKVRVCILTVLLFLPGEALLLPDHRQPAGADQEVEESAEGRLEW